MRHLLGADELVEFLFGQVAEFQGGLLQAGALVMGFFGDFGGFVVADLRTQRGDQHQRILHVLLDALLIQLHSVARSGR